MVDLTGSFPCTALRRRIIQYIQRVLLGDPWITFHTYSDLNLGFRALQSIKSASCDIEDDLLLLTAKLHRMGRSQSA